jgi:thiamine-monophosphate kinase
MTIKETKFIKKYLTPLTFNNKNTLKLMDDVYYDSKNNLAFTTDTFEEGIHFVKKSKPKDFVKKIFRSSISDIFCKGLIPTTYFLSLSLKNKNINWIKEFQRELSKESKKFGVFLGGGDTIKSSKTSVSISFLSIRKNKPVLRSRAKNKDDIYVTNTLGDSFIGLLIYLKKIKLGNLNGYYKKKFSEPNLPVDFSKHIHKFASSSTDISDGLIVDLQNICSASRCGANIDFEKIPFSTKTKRISKKGVIKLINIFSRGDDYQILFTANEKFRNLIKEVSKKTNTKVTLLGKICAGNNVNMSIGGNFTNLSGLKTGYIHRF